MAGTPEQVISQANSLFEAGARRVEFGSPHGLTEEDGIRLLGERVLPLIASQAARPSDHQGLRQST